MQTETDRQKNIRQNFKNGTWRTVKDCVAHPECPEDLMIEVITGIHCTGAKEGLLYRKEIPESVFRAAYSDYTNIDGHYCWFMRKFMLHPQCPKDIYEACLDTSWDFDVKNGPGSRDGERNYILMRIEEGHRGYVDHENRIDRWMILDHMHLT